MRLFGCTYSLLLAELKSPFGSAHKAILLMNPSMTCCYDVVKANSNTQLLFANLIHIDIEFL